MLEVGESKMETQIELRLRSRHEIFTKPPKGARARRHALIDLIYDLFSIGDSFQVSDLPHIPKMRRQSYSGAVQYLKNQGCIQKAGFNKEFQSYTWKIVDEPVWIRYPRRNYAHGGS